MKIGLLLLFGCCILAGSPAFAGKDSPGNDRKHNGDQSQGDWSRGNDKRGDGGPGNRPGWWYQEHQPRILIIPQTPRYYIVPEPPPVYIVPTPPSRNFYHDPWKLYDDCMAENEDFRYCNQFAPE